MTRVLVIGRSGQLAQALAHVGGDSVTCIGRPEADLSAPDSLARIIEQSAPDIVLNAGAYTSVDGAESEPDTCFVHNVEGPAALASICASNGLPLIHLSTDCVFDGKKAEPYFPGDKENPLGVYGRTKLEGERAVRSLMEESIVVRVSWIFSRFGNNFVSTMLKLAQTRSEVTVVSDQYGCPTHAPDLARALLQIASKAAEGYSGIWGTYHLAGMGEIDRAAMATKIYEVSAAYGGPHAAVIPVLSENYHTPAQRPLNARLDMSDTTRVFGVTLKDWALGLDETVEHLVRELRGV